MGFKGENTIWDFKGIILVENFSGSTSFKNIQYIHFISKLNQNIKSWISYKREILKCSTNHFYSLKFNASYWLIKGVIMTTDNSSAKQSCYIKGCVFGPQRAKLKHITNWHRSIMHLFPKGLHCLLDKVMSSRLSIK